MPGILALRDVKAIYLFSAAALLACLPASAAAQNGDEDEPIVPLRRGDAAAYVGWFGGNKSELNVYEDWYKRTWHRSLSAGYYWTEHLKTELDFSGTTRGRLYGRPIPVETPVGVGITNPLYEFSTKSLTLVQQYQFGRNAWFHPTVGGGLALTWETERERYPPVYITTRGANGTTTTRVVQPEREEGPETTLRAGALATAGFKAYMSERTFFRSDLRVTFGRKVDDVAVRFGFGIDF